jgi:hypothetical protein
MDVFSLFETLTHIQFIIRGTKMNINIKMASSQSGLHRQESIFMKPTIKRW